MKRVGVLMVLMIFCVGLVTALDFNLSDFCNEDLPDDFALPSKAPFTNEVVNVYLAGESIGYVVLKDKKLESHGCGENKKPTYRIYIKNEQVVEDVLDSEDMVGEYNKQRKSGGLRIEAVGFFRNIKLFFINLFSRFF